MVTLSQNFYTKTCDCHLWAYHVRQTKKNQKNLQEKEPEREVKSSESESSDDLSFESTEPDDGVQLRPPKYKLPGRKGKYKQKRVPQNKDPRQRRGTRQRHAPDRFQN